VPAQGNECAHEEDTSSVEVDNYACEERLAIQAVDRPYPIQVNGVRSQGGEEGSYRGFIPLPHQRPESGFHPAIGDC
jgi:hypothetical protein